MEVHLIPGGWCLLSLTMLCVIGLYTFDYNVHGSDAPLFYVADKVVIHNFSHTSYIVVAFRIPMEGKPEGIWL